MVSGEANSIRPTVALAKLSRPRLPAVFPRERLFQTLDDHQHRPCCWIGAPGGYGKTMLAVSYVEARGIPHLWYQLDEDDSDLATFFYHLGIAAAGRGSGPPLPMLTPEYQGDVVTFTRRYVQNLCQRLRSPFIFLFDNYQRLAADAPFHAMLAEALPHLPAGMRCLITSRGEPPPKLARARLNGQLAVIDTEDLRLRLPESEGIADLRGEGRVSRDAVRSLNERVQGWAAGLTLLLQHSRDDPDTPAQAVTEILFGYFAEEVFRETDQATRTFLLKTALLPKMTAAMADRMTGGDGAGAVLDALVRRHYFTIRSEAAQPSYEYHDLFRAFLLRRGREDTSAAEREQDQRRAATILEAAGETGAAVDLWQELGDWEHLAEVVCRHAEALLRQGRGGLLESWLRDFPPEIMERSPWLLFWLGQCRLTRDAVAARSTLTNAYQIFEHLGDTDGLWLAWSAITDTYILAWDDFGASAPWLDEFERLRALYPKPGSDALEARVACGMFNLLVFARPDHPEFTDWEERVRRLVQSGVPPHIYLVTLNNLLFHYIWNVGRRGKAAWALSLMRAAHAHADQIEPVLRCARLCWEFCYQYWFEGDRERCLALAEEACDIAAEQGIGLFNSLALSGPVYVHLTTGDAQASRAALARFEPVLGSFRPLERGHYTWLSAGEALLSGRMSEALEMCGQALEISRGRFYQSEGFCQLAFAQMHAGLGDQAGALRQLAGMRPWNRAAGSRVGTFLRALAGAQFALARGRRDRALGLLRRALAVGREEGYVFFPLFKPDDIARLCAAALDADIETEYVQSLIRKRGLLPDPGIVTSVRWPWPVRLNVLGGFALEVDGRPVTFGRKVQRRPLELLKALIAAGGRDVRLEKLADWLWPDTEGDMAQNALATTIHRLRHLLGHSEALELRDRRLSLNPRYCWDLERQIRDLQERLSNVDANPAPKDLQSATQMLLQAYPGPLLAQESASWVVQARRRLADKYRKCLRALGAAWEKQGNEILACACRERLHEVELEPEAGR